MGQWGREHANGPKTAPSGPFVPKPVFRDAVAKARSYHFAKTTFTKTWCGPCLLRTQIFRIRKHVVFPALSDSKAIFSRTPLFGPWPLGSLEIVPGNSSAQCSSGGTALLRSVSHLRLQLIFQNSV